MTGMLYMMGMQVPTKDGVKHMLKPLKETDEKVCSATRVCVFDGRKFLDTMRHGHMCFSIIPKEGREEVEEVLAKDHSLDRLDSRS